MSATESSGDWEIDKICTKLRALPREDRLEAVNHILNKPPKRMSEKDLLQRRALLITALRTKGIWPVP